MEYTKTGHRPDVIHGTQSAEPWWLRATGKGTQSYIILCLLMKAYTTTTDVVVPQNPEMDQVKVP